MKRVFVAMSGGVDSSTAAHLLRAEGWDVVSRASGRTSRFDSIIKLVKDHPEYLQLVREKLLLNYLSEALGEETGKIVLDPSAVDGEVELWLQYPRKPIPFVEQAPILSAPTSQGD